MNYLRFNLRVAQLIVVVPAVRVILLVVNKTQTMALSKAIEFVKKVGSDTNLRTSCYEMKTRQELLLLLGFNEVEFEDAINMQLVKCQTYDEAEEFQQIQMWFLTL